MEAVTRERRSPNAGSVMSPGSSETVGPLTEGRTPSLPDSRHQHEEEAVEEDDFDRTDLELPLQSPPAVPDSEDSQVLVIGAGLMRTGTKSLQLALERVLNGRCYHMTRVFEHPQHIDVWRRACQKPPTPAEWRRLLSGYCAAVDMPPCVFYRELHQHFPKAKFVLTEREAKAWYRSVCATVLAANEEMKAPLSWFLLSFTPLRNHATMVDELCKRTLGPDIDWKDEEKMCARYQAHVDAVRNSIPQEQLLEFDPRDGWEPLCKFLDVPVPEEPYPHVNSQDDFLKNWRAFLHRQYFIGLRRLAIWSLAGILLAVAAIAARSY